MTKKRIFVTGGTGFIGLHVLRALCASGHSITALVRASQQVRLDAMKLDGLKTLVGEFCQPESWKEALTGHDTLIQLVGIIREQKGLSFEEIHQHAPIALFDAAKAAGVTKIVQLSAMGADQEAQSRYHLSKRAADQYLETLGLPYVVLRPSFVYGPQDHSMRFFASLAALPITPIPSDGQYQVQPIHIDDLVHAITLSCEREDIYNQTIDVGGSEILTYDEMMDQLANWSGKSKGATKLHVPIWCMKLGAILTDATGGFGPISSEELGMLLRGNKGDNAAFEALFGFRPISFSVGLARRPKDQEARWFVRLSPLRLLVRWSIAFIWIATGIVSAFVYPEQESLKLLAKVGVTGPLALLALYGTSYFEILIGISTAMGVKVRLMGWIQLAMMFGFMGFLTIGIPSMWWHPFGPLTKNIPLLSATLVMIAMSDT